LQNPLHKRAAVDTQLIQIISFVISIPVSYVTFRAVVGKYLIPKIIRED